MDFVDTLYSLNFLVDVLLFTVEEYSYFTLEGEMYHDQELADYANQLDKEEKEVQKKLCRMLPEEQLI
jgi:hypothetical protein